MMNITEDFKEMLASSITSIMNQIKTSEYSPAQKDSTKLPDPTTVVPVNGRSPPLDVGQSTKIGAMWTPKHEISSPKFYELLIQIELKVDTDIYLNNFYNHINMCLNALTRLREDLINSYQSNKRHSEFEEYFVPDRYHPS